MSCLILSAVALLLPLQPTSLLKEFRSSALESPSLDSDDLLPQFLNHFIHHAEIFELSRDDFLSLSEHSLATLCKSLPMVCLQLLHMVVYP